MMKQLLLMLIAFFLSSLKSFAQHGSEIQKFVTDCDSVYAGKAYRIVQAYYANGVDSLLNNSEFQLVQSVDTGDRFLYVDTIYSLTGNIEFRDFNGDDVKDVLIHYSADARSSWHYYLCLVGLEHDTLKKIKNFEIDHNEKYSFEWTD